MSKSTEEKRQNLAWLLEQAPNDQMLYVEHFMELARLLAQQMVEDEIQQYTGARYSRERPHGGRYDRYGFNPGSITVSNQRVAIDVPRLYDREAGRFQTLQSYQRLHHRTDIEGTDKLVRSILYGIGTRNYKGCVETLSKSFGLSKSSVSRQFVERTSEALEELQTRSLADEEWAAIFLDGKRFGDAMMVIALGITAEGRKRVLDITEATTENATVCTEFLSKLQARGVSADNGLLFIVDGGKGLRKAIDAVFGKNAVVQRCQWHKRENVVAYLPEEEQIRWRKRLQLVYLDDDYENAKATLEHYATLLDRINRSAGNSLREGLEETLALQRLGISGIFHRSFSTTNCIESLNSMLERTTQQVKYWKSSDQRQRWVSASALDAEQRMRKVDNAKHLGILCTAVKKFTAAQHQTVSGLEPVPSISTKKKT